MIDVEITVSAPLYVVECRALRGRSREDGWRTDGMGTNEPRPLAEVEEDCRTLPTLGQDWGDYEYRPREVRQ